MSAQGRTAWVEVSEQCGDEVSCNKHLVRFLVCWVARNVENSCPEQLLELNVLLSSCEQRLRRARAAAFTYEAYAILKFVVGGIVKHRLK